MSKSIFYRLFKMGKIPKTMNQSKLLTSDEGVKIVTIYKNFRAPGKRFSNKKRISLGSIMTTKHEIIAFIGSVQIMKLGLSDDRLKSIDFSGSDEGVFSMTFDPSMFAANMSGEVTYVFHTRKAQEILNRIDGDG